ncbi:fumarylacetoacetate hydrolase family protein [Bacillus alkalisoli]|uniref:fumarylacetoacetate hydrolase family protein n=1 Tax=Bacillus alkalisoli TaxID=2011008 RepID=UPI000C23E908|nr:fumarylacetoacetate hydrolase family protein [Bacillus alkalisoli]
MKLLSFKKQDGFVTAGWLDGEFVVDMHESSNGKLPNNLLDFIQNYDQNKHEVDRLLSPSAQLSMHHLNSVEVLAPIQRPVSIRDFYAFEKHVKTARGRRGLDVVPEWYEIPVFYFTNHLAVKGPNESIERPANCEWLDYELEIACVIGKEGENIKVENAEEYIFGYCIMNDWSARDLQAKEMKVGLGPAKGKDFATSFGPYIVTKEHLATYQSGKGLDLTMTAKVNGKLLSEGNFKDIYYSFAEMIERASDGVTLYPGEIIGSGTVGTGCILEIGTDVHRWLQPGDVVELEITELGTLKNTIQV